MNILAKFGREIWHDYIILFQVLLFSKKYGMLQDVILCSSCSITPMTVAAVVSIAAILARPIVPAIAVIAAVAAIAAVTVIAAFTAVELFT